MTRIGDVSAADFDVGMGAGLWPFLAATVQDKLECVEIVFVHLSLSPLMRKKRIMYRQTPRTGPLFSGSLHALRYYKERVVR